LNSDQIFKQIKTLNNKLILIEYIEKILNIERFNFINENKNIPTRQAMWNMFPLQKRKAIEANSHIHCLAQKKVSLMGGKTKHDDPC
jgi:hypothetical protein